MLFSRKLSVFQAHNRRRAVAWTLGALLGAFSAFDFLDFLDDTPRENSLHLVFDASHFQVGWNLVKNDPNESITAGKGKTSDDPPPSLASELKIRDRLAVVYYCEEPSSVYGVEGSTCYLTLRFF